jgi:hypothetical protein
MELHQPKALRLWRGLAIAFALFVIATNIAYIAYAFGDLPGTLGGHLTLVPAEERGVAMASAVVPGSPLAKAGVTDGAKVRLDRPFDAFRYAWAGEQVGVTLLDAAPPRHVEITVAPISPDERLRLSRLYLIDGLSALVASTVGLIILLRSGGAWSLIVLGLAFAAFDYTTSPLQSDPRTIAAWHVLYIANRVVTPLLFLDFALRFYRENVAPLARWVRPLFAVSALVAGIAGIAAYFSAILGFFLVPAEAEFSYLTQGGIFLSAIAAFVMGWRESTPALRRRYTVMLVALACFILAALTRIVASLVTGIFDLSQLPFAALMAFEILATAAPLLFAYAVLRHKVVDIGFAVNRALVYGVVSTILLVAFGIVEWASEHFLPIKNLEANALIDGGIALAIFLTFHRLRDLSGHVIEGLFFSQWRENEALLRRFVKEAAFIGTKAALGKAMVAEWTRFSGGASSALYLAGAGRDFVAFQGALAGAHIDGDDPLIVALRAHGEAVELSDTRSLLPASLALPMRHRGELTGLMLMAAKPSGDPYRPDERALLGWAAHQVGLDLQALETEQLQEDISRLRQDCAGLTAQLELVRELKAAAKPG